MTTRLHLGFAVGSTRVWTIHKECLVVIVAGQNLVEVDGVVWVMQVLIFCEFGLKNAYLHPR